MHHVLSFLGWFFLVTGAVEIAAGLILRHREKGRE